MLYHILAIGDVTSEDGLKHLRRHLTPLKKLKSIDFTVVNGENISGTGLTPAQADELFAAGADVITLGNHTFGRVQIADYLEDKPACPLCGDTGYDKKGVCRCLRQYYAREQLQELSRLLPLGEARFETFRFDLYDSAEWEGYGISPRANMERNFDVCRDFACQFSRGGGDLLLSGGTGLGKTFLSACIARVVSESGFSVVYDTAISIFAKLENDKFRPDEETAAEVRRCESCDLLILDDLGTEMTTSFVQSALYQLVNGRMIAGRSTIISTNLAPEELGQRYGAAILSRIEGGYEILPFFGEDIRRKR